MKKNRLIAISAVIFLSGCSSMEGITRFYATPKEAYPPAGDTYSVNILREGHSFTKVGNATQTPFLTWGWYRSIPAVVSSWDVIGVDDTELGDGYDTGAIGYQTTFMCLNQNMTEDPNTGTYTLEKDIVGDDLFDYASAVASDTPNLFSPAYEYVYALQITNRSLETLMITSWSWVSTSRNYGLFKGIEYPDGTSMPSLDIDNVSFANYVQYGSFMKLNPYESGVLYISYYTAGNYISGTTNALFTITRLGATLDGLYADMYDDFYDEGYSNAENEIQAIPNQIESVWDILSSGVNVVNDLLSVEVLPNVPISLFIAIPMVLALLFWFIDELRNR